MLATSVYIYSPTSLGGGQYRFEMYVGTSTKAKHLNVNDYVKDTASNEYKVESFTSPFSDGGLVTVSFVTNDVLPVEDADYDSSWYTPGQEDLRPFVQTPGELSSITVYDAPAYEYSLLATWVYSGEANKAVVGDVVVDATGYEYEISYIDSVDRFNVDIRVKEVERIGRPPTVGVATLYRPTFSYGFFQGTELTNLARTAIRNRDMQLIDNAIAAGGGGGSSANLTKVMANEDSATIEAGVPVSKLSTGGVVKADSDGVSRQQLVGITKEEIAVGSTGEVYLLGQNIPGVLTGMGFAVGDEIYLSESLGGYTNDPDSYTSGDDSIIKIGIADCSVGVASAVATDLILFPDVIIRP